MAMGRSNSSIEVQVSLGLQEANQQIAMLHKQLEESVKVDSKGFSSITKLLDNATNQAEKLGVKMSDAFKTSAGSKSFLRDYQKMLDTLSQIRSKMGNLGFEDIKFSVDDQNTINNTVKQMEELQKALDGISRGKAIEVIDRSAVDNVDLLKQTIKDLSIDTSKLTFDNLRTRLSDAADEASKKLEETRQKITDIDRVTKNLDAAGLVEIQSKLNTSQGLNIKLIDDRSIDTANERLRELKAGLDDISDKTKSKLQVTQKTNDVGNFIIEQTKSIKAEYTTQLETIRECKAQIQQALANIDAGGHRGENNGRQYFTNEELTSVLNSDAVKASLATLGINIEEAFAGMNISQKVAKLRHDLSDELSKINARDVQLTDLRDSVEEKLTAVFDGLTTSTVTNVGKLQKSISGILDGVEINVGDLKKFGFDVNSIQAGESLAAVYDRLKAAIEGYRDALSTESTNLNNTELAERQKICDDLAKSIEAANQAETESGNVAEQIKVQIATLTAQVADLVKKYNELTGKKIELDFGQTVQKTQEASSIIQKYIGQVSKLESKQKTLSNVQMAITRWMGFYQVLNLTKRAVSDMKQHIQELDAVMTKIAVVTNMTQNDLWNQIGTYSEIARQYGVAIKGVYEVSQLYYQQGLNKGDVMGLTTETLKMARIAGIDYATAADYMTTAVRGFKLEMSDAAHVTDVFSNLAAHTASSTEELAVAISKTAASAASVGASFEATSAMMSTMIATTRESATNIGTALKSIISRYGELKQNMTGTDAEGEAYSLNKVDKALQSVGISIHDASGQFRDFDDVILELAEAWDTIDKNTQRYIATVMAGNRQQSRFLALVSNVEEYKRALELANNSDNVGELQVLKTLDSVDAKIERMKVTIQEFYTSSGIQDLYKGILDTITNVIRGANELPKIFGKFPALALTIGFQIVNIVKQVIKLAIVSISSTIETLKGNTQSVLQGLVQIFTQKGKESGRAYTDAANKEMQNIGKNVGSTLQGQLANIIGQRAGALLSLAGSTLSISALSAYGASTSKPQDQAAAGQMFGAAALTGGGSALTGAISGFLTAGPLGALAGGVMGLVSGLPSLISAINMNNVSLAREIELQGKKVEEAKQTEMQAKGSVKELEVAVEKLASLKDASTESADALQEYKDYMNQLADTYPELISKLELTGDKTLILADLEQKLANARIDAAKATIERLKEERDLQNKQKTSYENIASLNNLPSEISSDNANFDYLTKYLSTYGNSWQMTALQRGDKYAALMNLYNANYRRLGYTDQAPVENFDSWGNHSNERWVRANLDKINKLQALVMESSQGNSLIRSQLKTSLSNFLAENNDVQLAELTTGKLNDLKDLDNEELSTQELIDIMNTIHEHAQEYVNSMSDSLNDLDKTINSSELQLRVDTAIGTQKVNNKSLSDYSSFITSMINYQYGESYNWEDESSQVAANTATAWWAEWLKSNMDNADWLISNLDFSTIRDVEGLDKILTDHGLTEEVLGPEFIANINKAFTEAHNELKKNYEDNLLAVFETDTRSSIVSMGHGGLYNLFNGYIGKYDNIELSQVLAEKLQSLLPEYKKLKAAGQTQLAENYLKGLERSYLIIGSYNNEQQQLITSLISSLDWQDADQLKSAADQLRELGPEYEDLASQLEMAAIRFSSNLTTQVLQLSESSVETAKSIEKVTDSISKAFKPSEALENANTILEAYTGEDKDILTFDSIYEWSDALNGYILTNKGIQVWLDSINATNIENIEAAQAQLNDLKLFFGENGVHGLLFFEDNLNYDDALHIIQQSYTDEQGNISISEDEIEAKTDQFMKDYEALQKEFSEQTDLTWAEFISEKKAQLITSNEEQINILLQMSQRNFVTALANIDYKGIAGGTAGINERSKLETLLVSAGISPAELGDAFDNIWARLLEGDYEAFNELLTKYGVEFSITGSAAAEGMRSEFEQYQSALDEVLNTPIALWSDATKELAGIDENTDLSSIDIGALASQFLEEISILFSRGALSIEEQNESIAKVVKQRQKEAGIGREKAFYDALKDGFTVDELNELGGFGEDGELIPALQGILEQDSITGNFKVIAKGTAIEVLTTLANALGIALDTTSDEYKDAVATGIDEGIKARENANKGKQIAKTLSDVASASIGDEININALTADMKTALGLDANAETMVVESEERRDALLLLLETSISMYNGEGSAALQKAYEDIKSQILSKKGNKGQELSAMFNKSITEDTAKTFLKGKYGDNMPEDVHAYLVNVMHYTYDAFSETYTATEDTLDALQKELDYAKSNGASAEYLTQLQTTINQIKYQLQDNPAKNALVTLLQSYADVGDDALAAFDAQFADINVDDYVDEVNGKKVLRILELKEALGEEWASYFDEYIEELSQSYMENIQSATQLTMQGTTSTDEMQKFVDLYNKAFEGENKTIGDLFHYDEVLEAWTLDSSVLSKYTETQAKALEEAGLLNKEDIDKWIESQTSKVLANQINISDFLSAEDRNIGSEAYKKLTEQMRAYWTNLGATSQEAASYISNSMYALSKGGSAAVNEVKAWAARQGREATSEEIEAAFNSAINDLNNALDSIADITIGQLTTGKLREHLAKLGKVDSSGVVTSVDDMTAVYLSIYREMKVTAGRTTAGLNAAYAKVLTAGEQKDINTLDALENAAGMTYDALGELLSTYGQDLETFMNGGAVNGIEKAGFGKIRIIDWDTFATSVFGENYDSISSTPEYVEAYSAWVDSRAEFENREKERVEAAIEEIEAIGEASSGESINVSDLDAVLKGGLQAAVKDYAVSLNQGLLTIRDAAEIPSIMSSIMQVAQESKAMLPEQLAALADAINQMLADITDLITNGISKGLNNQERAKLVEWASGQGLELNFNETIDGFKLTNDSAKALYKTMNDINTIQGQIVFNELKDNLIETDEHFKSASANAAYIRQLETQGLNDEQSSILQSLNGNVNMFARPVLQNEDGTISTLLTATEESRNYESEIPWVMNITPITPTGKKLDDTQLQEYIQKLVEDASGNMDEMIKLDKGRLGLIIEGENTEIEQQEEILDKYDQRAEKLHLIGEIIEKNKEKSAEELALAQKIAEARGLQEDASFKFMEQSIPSGQNNPLNYWENWGKAYKAMNEAASGSSKGKMEYQDFYNLVTEMGHLAEITDQSVHVGGQVLSNAQEAASLIEKAAGALEVQSDGSLKINLSKIGVDFASGADQMAADVDAGIHQVAESQIEMLDSLIGLLEVIVAMEKMSDLDVDADMTLDLDEIFDSNDPNEITDFSGKWKDALDTWRNMMTEGSKTFNEDFKRGMESIKFTINGETMSLADVINMSFEEVESQLGPDTYQAIMNGLYESVRSGDFSETNIKELIMQNLQKHLESTGGNVVFDMGNYTFVGKGNAAVTIDWDADSTKAALDEVNGSKKDIITAAQAVLDGSATDDQLELDLIVKGKVKVDKDTKAKSIHFDGEDYTPGSKEWANAMGAALLETNGAKGVKFEYENESTASGTITYGETKVTAIAKDGGGIKFASQQEGVEGEYDSLSDVLAAEVDYALEHDDEYKDLTGEDKEAKRVELLYSAEVKAGIKTFELNSQSYQGIDEDVRKRLEDALASGNGAEIELAIKADPKLASLEGLSSSEIEEKLGLKAIKIKFEGDTEKATADIKALEKSVDALAEKSPTEMEVKVDENQEAYMKLRELQEETDTLDNMHPIVDVDVNDYITDKINAIKETINSLQGKTVTVTTNYVQNGTPHLGGSGHAVEATGNVGLAKAQGTLMGELGPELVVSNGRYFVVGQSGAEFVNLADDAIVFNHLQTEQLLKKGMSATRGRAVTNEQNAVSFAHGNVNGGLAMASASAVLAQLKQLRAMWESLLGASAKDLVGKAGSGGGGGGGKENAVDPAFIKQLERWYNLLQDIATLEEKINYQENLRKKISGSYIGRNGKDYYNSQKQSLKLLEEEIQKHQQLVKEQKEYYKLRQAQLNSQSAFSSLYTFDENGQIKYKSGKFEELTAMFSANPTTGKPNHTVEEQYNYLMSQGYGYAMQYDSEGNKIDTSTAEGKQQAIQAFWDKIEADQNEMQGLHDSITEHENAILEAQEQQNEILKEIEDNQIALENQVLDAIVDAAQREIDAIQDEKDALEKSNQEFLDGLNDALQKERDMYASQQNEADLMNKRRRLSLLQRTGGSASEISSLQAEIDDATRDLYFEKQQEQIDAIQAASDAQLEKLQQQIDLAQESLEYQKEHGLLWGQVYEVMAKSPEEIAQFIEENDSKHWAESPTQFAQSNRDILFQAEQWRAFAEDTSNKTVEDLLKSIQKEVKKKLKSESSGSSSSGGSGSGGGGGGSSGGSSDSGSGGGGSGGGNANGNTPSSTPPTTTWTRHAKLTYINTDYGQKVVTGTGTSKTSIAEAQANALADAKSKAAGFRDTVNVSYYSAGGLNDYTGLAMLHGTPSKPEAVLNATQTSILRNEILGHGKDSLLNLLQDFRATYSNMATGSNYSSVDSSSSVIIEHAEVNMKVDKLANGYDAARAGDDVMREILNIARKTGTQNRVGR